MIVIATKLRKSQISPNAFFFPLSTGIHMIVSILFDNLFSIYQNFIKNQTNLAENFKHFITIDVYFGIQHILHKFKTKQIGFFHCESFFLECSFCFQDGTLGF